MQSPLTFQTTRREIASLPIFELAEQFGTPTFFYDAATIKQRLADLGRFDTVRYAQKACSNLAVLDLVRRSGGLVDAVSAMEIRRAMAAGFSPEGDPPGIVYTADIFDQDALDLCVEHGVHVNCGSPDMIDQLGERAPGVGITLRINPGFGHGHSQKTNTGGKQSKHGIWHTQIDQCVDRAANHNMTVTGLHMHIGSGTDLEHLSEVCGAMEEAALTVGPTLQSISAGGGLPTMYKPDDRYVELDAYFELWDDARGRLQRELGREIKLEIEPGRYLAAESGFLVAEIRAVKQQDDNTFYLLDAGFNNLARPILYGSYHPMAIAPKDGDTSRPTQPVIIGGPLCESGDIFTQEEGGFVVTRKLPRANVGDLLVIECTGAYGFVMGSNYNSRPLAAEVMIQDGKAELIRERQTFQDIIRGERIPAWE